MLATIGIAVIAVAGLLAGCGKDSPNKGGKVATDLTEAAARDHINTLLVDTLRALQPGVSLSRKPDNPNLGAFGDEAAITVPCDDSDLRTDGPVQLQIRYWLVGVPLGQNTHYFDLIRDYWTSQGFRLHPGADSRSTPVITPDGYRLNVQDAGKGDGSLSIGAGSPCFPQSGKGTTTPQPTEIKRPS
ncbi:hypothetical protein [Nocardia sp. NPDC051570]|uniref:hypothetical protein n=1 Tax=Nocardia sp. NPDC051570 TaxID=3364324 RepID=UPI003787819D